MNMIIMKIWKKKKKFFKLNIMNMKIMMKIMKKIKMKKIYLKMKNMTMKKM